jgi:hypothetical protein
MLQQVKNKHLLFCTNNLRYPADNNWITVKAQICALKTQVNIKAEGLNP